MNWIRTALACVLSLTFVAALRAEEQKAAAPAATPAVAAVGQKAPEFTLTDAAGKKHSLADYKGKYVVLEWVNFGCPFVRKHYDSKNMQGLQARWTGQDVVWLSICSSAQGKQGYYEGEALTKQLQKEGVKSTAYLIDADGVVGRKYEAQTTPHMYVIDPQGLLIYAGAIDDRPSAKPEDIAGAVNYVSEALAQARAGKPLSTSWTKSYGCSVKYGG
jgi:peroxiredoxin